jgi:Na+/proline symporter
MSASNRERIDGLAVFSAAAFGLGLGLIAALERVGAPDGFVAALGPLLALLGICVIGVLTRASSLPDFLAARRAMPPFYGGLAFAGVAAGLATAMAAQSDGAARPPWLGIAAGLVAAALIVAPRWRAENASSVGDVLATRFPARATRIGFAVILLASGLLTAIAGFELATNTLVVSMGVSRRAAEALVMLALALSTVPGGLKGASWSDAASAGGSLLILAIGAAVAISKSPGPSVPLTAGVSAALAASDHGGPSQVTGQIAAALAVAGFFVFAPPAIGAASVGQARRTGYFGIAIGLVGLALADIALPYVGASEALQTRTAAALIATATWLPALVLARAGVLGAARAIGLDLATAYSRLTVLSSQRIAWIRLAMVAAIVICPFAMGAPRLADGRALYLALAIGLAFITPSLLLGWIWRAPTGSALFALAVAAAASVPIGAPPMGMDLLIDALIVGAASLLAGAAFALIFPSRRRRRRPLLSDPYVEVPLDPAE